ncbi:MAG: hypothetical protein C6Y20_02300 [Tagaea sp. CACIAM 22H2]|nr:hypothetical protein [Tagaea sp. CACIAM 22H2]
MQTIEKIPNVDQVAHANRRLNEIASKIGDLRQREARALAERRSMPQPRDAYDRDQIAAQDRTVLALSTQIGALENEARTLAVVVEDHNRQQAAHRAREKAAEAARDRDLAADLAVKRMEIARTIDKTLADLAVQFSTFENLGNELAALEAVTKLSSGNLRSDRAMRAAVAATGELRLATIFGHANFADSTGRLHDDQRALLAHLIPAPTASAAE